VTVLQPICEDPSGGGLNIPAGSTVAHIDAYAHQSTYLSPLQETASFQILERYAAGPTIVTGGDTTPGPFVAGNTFTLGYTFAGSANNVNVVVTLTGTTVADFLTSISAALPSGAPVSVTQSSTGAIVFTHSQGGDIFYYPGNNGFVPLTAAGFTAGVTQWSSQRKLRTNLCNSQ
jgi:hypothetical protein